jgi:hypothetical protein
MFSASATDCLHAKVAGRLPTSARAYNQPHTSFGYCLNRTAADGDGIDSRTFLMPGFLRFASADYISRSISEYIAVPATEKVRGPAKLRLPMLQAFPPFGSTAIRRRKVTIPGEAGIPVLGTIGACASATTAVRRLDDHRTGLHVPRPCRWTRPSFPS